MARQGNLNISGSVRVAQTAANGGPGTAEFVEETNNGAFASIAYLSDGDAEITIDDDYRLSVADVVEGQIEGTVVATAIIERISETLIRVRTQGQQAGLPVMRAVPYALNITQRFFG